MKIHRHSFLVFVLLALLVPDGLIHADVSTKEAQSKSGRYKVKLVSQTPIPLNEYQSWTLQVERSDHKRVVLRDLLMDGGMPAHGHDLPSTPKIVWQDHPGRYGINGLLFSMPGNWDLQFLLVDSEGTDLATFSIAAGEATPRLSTRPDEVLTPEEKMVLKGLVLVEKPMLPKSTGNEVADNAEAIELGHKLFFDSNLSPNHLACSNCHDPKFYFTDQKTTASGYHQTTLLRNTPTIVGSAYSHWFFWDGRRDSLWSQALVPLESAAEMGGNRLALVRYVTTHARYSQAYKTLFGALPALPLVPANASPIGNKVVQKSWESLSQETQNIINDAFTNIGKVFEAYERRLNPGQSSFDKFVEGLDAGKGLPATVSREAIAGMKIFISSEAQCTRCHNGPMFTNGSFQNVGTSELNGARADFGRAIGVKALFATEFNCLGPYNGDPAKSCPDLVYLNRHEEEGRWVGAYKVPSLRNVLKTAPYMHDGRFRNLAQVIQHYRDPGQTKEQMLDFRPVADLSPTHIKALIAFLKTLNSPIDADARLLRP